MTKPSSSVSARIADPNQLRKAKLKRTKFVILSEAEGPAFFSSHYASSEKRKDRIAGRQS
jgi:hypothetical protein